jgi:peptidoglycan hydrolase CwlO-like protein
MEITDLKEKNDELENRYEDWEQRLSSLIEKFEQLEAVEVEAEVDTSIQKDEEAEEVVAEETEAEEVVAEETEAEEVVAVETEEAEVDTDTDTEEFEGDEIKGSTFGTSADSYTEAPGSSQHYA